MWLVSRTGPKPTVGPMLALALRMSFWITLFVGFAMLVADIATLDEEPRFLLMARVNGSGSNDSLAHISQYIPPYWVPRVHPVYVIPARPEPPPGMRPTPHSFDLAQELLAMREAEVRAASGWTTIAGAGRALEDPTLPAASVRVGSKPRDVGCRGFFAVFASIDQLPHAGDRDGVVKAMGAQLEYYSAQMVAYDRELLVFVSSAAMAQGLNATRFPRVNAQVFDANELLKTCGFTSTHLEEISRWSKDGDHTFFSIPRVSDIIRLCLAKRYRRTYVDFDVLLLDATPNRFERPFVPAGLWTDRGSSIEFSNCIFCLAEVHVDWLLDNVRAVMERKLRLHEQYYYTELGPVAFARMMLHPRITLFDQPDILPEQHPSGFTVEDMALQACRFNMSHFHLTGVIRSQLRHTTEKLPGSDESPQTVKDVRYRSLVQTLRCATGSTPLVIGNAAPFQSQVRCRCGGFYLDK
jgi:hypothetical protein